MQAFGVDGTVATVFMTMNVSALALTSLDAVARIGRTSFSEFFATSNDALAVEHEKTGVMKVLGNPWVATVVTLLPGLALTFGGYLNIWPLFGASNQLLGGMTMITLAVFCKCTGRSGWMLYAPVAFLLVCTFTSLGMSIAGCVTALQAGGMAVMATSGLQLVFAVLLVALGLIVAVNCLKELRGRSPAPCPTRSPEWSEVGRRNCSAHQAAAADDAPEGPCCRGVTGTGKSCSKPLHEMGLTACAVRPVFYDGETQVGGRGTESALADAGELLAHEHVEDARGAPRGANADAARWDGGNIGVWRLVGCCVGPIHVWPIRT